MCVCVLAKQEIFSLLSVKTKSNSSMREWTVIKEKEKSFCFPEVFLFSFFLKFFFFFLSSKYLGYATFTVGVVYGLTKRQSVGNAVAEARAAKIAALEKTVAEKDAQIAALKNKKD